MLAELPEAIRRDGVVVLERSKGRDATRRDMPELIRQLELPKVNAWQVAELARHAAQDVKVVLSGLGGDELFYGYNMHSIMARTESIGRLPGAARRAAGGLLAALLRFAPTPWTEPQRMALMLAEAVS